MTDTTRTRRAFLARGVSAAVLLTAIASVTSLFVSPVDEPQQQHHRESRHASIAAAQPATTTDTNTAVFDPRDMDAALGQRIDGAINDSEFASAQWGVVVMSLRDGRTIYERNADQLFTPASNMKVYTTAVALDLLGADYRWRTSVYADAMPDADGTLDGDLVLYGRGAPDLASRSGKRRPTAHLTQLAAALYERGVRRVRGDVIGDESYFRVEEVGDGWLWEDVQWYFGAAPSALSVDGNEVTVSIAPAAKVGDPAAVKVIPPTESVRVTSDARTAERGSRPSVGVQRELSSNEVRVWGNYPAGSEGYGVRLSVHRPARWAATLFSDALKARGIAVEGGARARDWRTQAAEDFDPNRAIEMAAVLSRPLGEIVHDTNKESLNLEAELLLRTLGKEHGDLAPVEDPERMRVRRDDEAGLAMVRKWLEEVGGRTRGMTFHDGSGLSRLNLVTPRATALLMRRMAERPPTVAKIFLDSLPIGGRDGTLEYRLRTAGAAGQRLTAKTGALTYVHALSGYATTAEGEVLVFSIICNNETERAPGTRLIDIIASLLISYPTFNQ